MKSSIIMVAVLLYASISASAQTNTIDTELSLFAENLAGIIKERGSKKVTVLDFTDLQGHPKGELGRYIAEQLTVNLVIGKRDFAVLDRANLKSILAEHKLTASGLVDPENAKKLGMFAGVDALILGTILPKANLISLNAKIITTETAQIIGAARAEFKSDETVQSLTSQPAVDEKAVIGTSAAKEKPPIVKTFENLRVEFQPLQILNGQSYLLTMNLSNPSATKSTWVALNLVRGFYPVTQVKITDPEGYEFDPYEITGIATGDIFTDGLRRSSISSSTEIMPGSSIPVTVKLRCRNKAATQGTCKLQIEFVLGYDFHGDYGRCLKQNFITKIETE